jgi:tetratricopeptide (TPR) repeat protein
MKLGASLARRVMSIMLGGILALLNAPGAAAEETSVLDKALAEIQYQVTAIEHQPGDKVKAYARLVEKADALVQAYPKRAEPLVWKGIALLLQTKYAGLKALPNVFQARRLLEASLTLDPKANDGAAYLTLAMLYYQVPRWPLGFRSDQQAEMYFAKALEVASHLDSHYRYGEYLLAKKRLPQARAELQLALAFPERAGQPADPIKKKDIRKLLDRIGHAARQAAAAPPETVFGASVQPAFSKP